MLAMPEWLPGRDVAEPVGSPAELARAVRLRYFRTSHPFIPGRNPDPRCLLSNLHIYFDICESNNWPVVIIRPEHGRATWGIVAQHPPARSLPLPPGAIIDRLHIDILNRKPGVFSGCKIVYIISVCYNMIQGLTLPAAEYMAFGLADGLSRLMEEHRSCGT